MRPLPRPFPLLLLLPLVLGVLGMHTLGHVSGGHSPHATSAELPMAAPAGEIVAGPVPELRVEPGEMCLTILTSVLVLLLAAAWAATLRWPVRTAVGEPGTGGVARSPPRRLAPGPVLLSVMRL